ncbi:hypothetical protein HaLaN_24113, partial [Haematococcus lacustris]
MAGQPLPVLRSCAYDAYGSPTYLVDPAAFTTAKYQAYESITNANLTHLRVSARLLQGHPLSTARAVQGRYSLTGSFGCAQASIVSHYSVAVSVVPGPPWLPNCYAAIRVSTMQAGDPDARIVVVLRDEYSNPTPVLAPLAATAIPDISGANISLPYQVFSSNPYDTHYSFSLAGLVKAGGYSLVVSYDGVILINGSARVSVTPAQVSARDSRVVGYAAGTPYDDDGSPPAEVFTVLTA